MPLSLLPKGLAAGRCPEYLGTGYCITASHVDATDDIVLCSVRSDVLDSVMMRKEGEYP